MKNSIARFCLFFAAFASALAQPTVPVSNLSPVPSGTVVGRSSAGTGRAETLTAGTGITIANGQISSSGGAGDAPAGATYILKTANATLTNAQALSSLSSGVVTVTTGTGVLSSVAPGTSGNIVTSNGTGWISAAPATSGNVTAAGTLDSGNIVIGQGAKTIATSSALSVSGSNVTITGNLAITGSTTFNNLTTSNLTVTGNIVGNLAASQVTIADAGGYYTGTEVESALQEVGGNIVALQSVIGPTPSGNQLISGGGVALAPGGGLDITVSAASYLIQGTNYTSALTNLTLSAADPSNPRIDVVAVNSSGNAVIIQGTPAATPAKPDVDPATQLELTFFLVGAGATDLDVDVVDVYLNNAEWTTSTNSAGTINVASTNNPYTGANCIEGTTVTTGNYVRFVKPASGTFDMADSDNLVFYIRSKASWANNRIMSITVRDASSVQLGSSVTFDQGLFGFNSGQTTTYQQIIIPTALFAANGLTASQIQITLGGSGGTVGFYIDDVTLQGGVASITDASRMKWRGNYLASNFYNVNDVVLSSGIQYVAIQAGVGNTPASSPTFWQASSTSTGGTVTVSGTPTSGQMAEWTSATNIQGLAVTGSGSGVRATSPTITTPSISGAISFPDGVRQTFNPDGTSAGINVGSQAGDPSSPSNGDLWYDSTANELTARINGSNVALGAGGGGSPGGSNTQVQFNDSSSFGGDAGFVYDKTTDNVTAGAINVTANMGAEAASKGAFVFASGTAQLISQGADTSTQGKIQLRSFRSTSASGNVNAFDWDSTKLELRLLGTSYFHVGVGAYQLGVYTVFNSFQIPYAKTDTTQREALYVTGNDASNPFGLGVSITGNASANSRAVTLSSGDIGSTVGILRFTGYTYDFTQQNSASTTSSRITSTSALTTLEAVPSNAATHIKPNGTGYMQFGASSYSTGAFSIYSQFAYPFAKTDASARNAFFFGSNDASNPFGLLINVTGNATAASRIVKLALGAVGVDEAGILQLTATNVVVTNTTASTSTTTGALISSGGLGVAGRTSTATLNVGTGTTITSIFSASGAMNFGSINADAEETQTLTVTGVVTTNTPAVALGWSAALEDGIVVKQAWVSGADTVSVRVRNVSGSPIDPASVTVRATVTGF